MSMIAKGIEKVQAKTFHMVVLICAIVTAILVGSCALADEPPPDNLSLPEVAEQMIQPGDVDASVEDHEGFFQMLVNSFEQIKEEFARLMADKDDEVEPSAETSDEGDVPLH